MTGQQFITIFVGLLFCFCLLSKQAVQNYDDAFDLPSVQDVLTEAAYSDDFVDAIDSLIPASYVFIATFMFVLAPIFSTPRYVQPLVRSPQRPPSIQFIRSR